MRRVPRKETVAGDDRWRNMCKELVHVGFRAWPAVLQLHTTDSRFATRWVILTATIRAPMCSPLLARQPLFAFWLDMQLM